MLLGIWLVLALVGPAVSLGQATALANPAVAFSPPGGNVLLGAEFEIDLRVTGVSNLQTVDLTVGYDPNILAVVDSQPGTPSSVEIEPGDIFPSTVPLLNAADTPGQVRYSILGPSGGLFTGDGTIATITFEAIHTGSSALQFTYLSLTGGNGLTITHSVMTATVEVHSVLTETPTPTSSPTTTLTPSTTPSPTVSNTPSFTWLPILLKEWFVQGPTETPTYTPTATATRTFTATPTRTLTPSATPTPSTTLTPSITPTPSNTLTASATPTPSVTETHTTTPTATPTGAACSELVVNGTCETTAGWYFPVTAYSAGYSEAQKHAGRRSIRTGIATGSPIYSFSAAEQAIYIPTDAKTMRLSFWYYAQSTSPFSDDDWSYVLLIDERGIKHYLLRIQYPNTNLRAWTKAEFTEQVLAPYRGQTVYLHFETFNTSGGGITALYADDISFQACR